MSRSTAEKVEMKFVAHELARQADPAVKTDFLRSLVAHAEATAYAEDAAREAAKAAHRGEFAIQVDDSQAAQEASAVVFIPEQAVAPEYVAA